MCLNQLNTNATAAALLLKCFDNIKIMKKTTISIDEFSITIPYNGTDINDLFKAFELALQLYGWHDNTIKEYIKQKAAELENDEL